MFCAHDLLLGGGLLAGHDALIGMLDAVIPNLVNVAGKGFGVFLSVAVFSNQLVHVVQLLLIVVGNGDSFLVGVQNDTHNSFLQKKNV